MRARLLFLACLALLCRPAMPQAPQLSSAPVAGASVADAMDKFRYGKVEGPGMRLYAIIAGTTTAEDFTDIKAPFDGSVGELKPALFDWVKQDAELGFMASKEMAALLDVSSGAAKSSIKKKWDKTYDYYKITAPDRGLVVKVGAAAKDNVAKGQVLITLARKISLIAKTSGALYAPLEQGMRAELKSADGRISASAVLRRFIRIGAGGQYQLKLEVVSADADIRPGMAFSGGIVLVDHPKAAKLPKNALISKNGRTYILQAVEVRAGIEDDRFVEAAGVEPGDDFIYPESIIESVFGAKK